MWAEIFLVTWKYDTEPENLKTLTNFWKRVKRLPQAHHCEEQSEKAQVERRWQRNYSSNYRMTSNWWNLLCHLREAVCVLLSLLQGTYTRMSNFVLKIMSSGEESYQTRLMRVMGVEEARVRVTSIFHFSLSCYDRGEISREEEKDLAVDNMMRGLFVQEMLLSTLLSSNSDSDNTKL